MDKLTVDTNNGNSPQAWLTLTALMLETARQPALLDGATAISVTSQQRTEIRYGSAAEAEAAERLVDYADAVIKGTVLWPTPKTLNVRLRGAVEDAMLGWADGQRAGEMLTAAYPAGVCLVTVVKRGVSVLRVEGTRLPPVWRRFGRLDLCDALNVELTWVSAAKESV